MHGLITLMGSTAGDAIELLIMLRSTTLLFRRWTTTTDNTIDIRRTLTHRLGERIDIGAETLIDLHNTFERLIDKLEWLSPIWTDSWYRHDRRTDRHFEPSSSRSLENCRPCRWSAKALAENRRRVSRWNPVRSMLQDRLRSYPALDKRWASSIDILFDRRRRRRRRKNAIVKNLLLLLRRVQ